MTFFLPMFHSANGSNASRVDALECKGYGPPVKRGWLVFLVAVGCAQAQSGGRTSSTGGGGRDLAISIGEVDMATAQPDLYGVDLAGADLSRPSGDLADNCNYVTQMGCGANEKCVYAIGGPLCVSNGSVDINGLCGSSMTPPSTNDQCKAALACITVGMAGTAYCHEYCNVDVDCNLHGSTFAGGLPPKCLTSTSLPFKLCSTSCAPFNAGTGNNGCPMATTCRYGWDSTAKSEETVCTNVGASGEGVACADTIDCTGGFTCVDVNMMGAKCRKICRPGMAGDCTVGGQLCRTVYTQPDSSFGFCF